MGASYSLSYGTYVVCQFHKTYPRASVILQEMYLFRPTLPAWLFCNDQRRWRRYKQCVKLVEIWTIDEPSPIDRKVLESLKLVLEQKDLTFVEQAPVRRMVKIPDFPRNYP